MVDLYSENILKTTGQFLFRTLAWRDIQEMLCKNKIKRHSWSNPTVCSILQKGKSFTCGC